MKQQDTRSDLGAKPSRLCAVCDSPDNLQKDHGAGGLNDACLGCFYIWYDGPTESYWDETRRRQMTSGESMRRASLAAKVEAKWPYDGSQLPVPTEAERNRAVAAIATAAAQPNEVSHDSH